MHFFSAILDILVFLLKGSLVSLLLAVLFMDLSKAYTGL